MLGSAAFRTGIAPGGALAGPWVRDPLWTRARAVPSLDLRFADNKSLVDATTGANLVTFTRASSGTYVGSDGLIKSATTNEARFDHNPTTGESLGLLVEEARTNNLLQSEDFSSTWTLSNIAVTANSVVAPDGTTTADTIAPPADGLTVTRFLRQNPILTTQQAYTLSVFVKVGTATTNGISLYVSDSTAINNFRANFNLFNLTTSSTSTGWAVPTATIVPYSNGWYRCILTGVTSTVHVSLRAQIYLSVFGTVPDTYGSIHVWGADLQAGSFPTSYISTTSATVTRAADVASITGSNFSSWANNNEGTIFSDSSIIASQIKTQAVWELSGGIALSSLRQPQGTANQFRAVIGGTFTGSPGTGASLTTGVTLAAVAYSGTAGRLQIGSVGTDATGSTLDATSLSIGSLAGASQLNGRIKRLCFWPARLPDATLQQITQ